MATDVSRRRFLFCFVLFWKKTKFYGLLLPSFFIESMWFLAFFVLLSVWYSITWCAHTHTHTPAKSTPSAMRQRTADEERRNEKMKMIMERALKVKATARRSLHMYNTTQHSTVHAAQDHKTHKFVSLNSSTHKLTHACKVCFHHSLSIATLRLPAKVAFSCSQFSLAKAFLIPQKK